MRRLDSGIFSRTVLSTAGMGVQGVARLLYTVAIGRLAGDGALGDTTALLSLAVYASLMLPAGLGVAASRFLPTHDLASPAIGVLNRWFWVSSVMLAVAAAPIAFALTHDLASAICCVALVWSYNAYVYSRGVLMGEDRILRSTLADFGSSILAITALASVLIADASWALLLPLSLGYAVYAFAGRPRTPPSASTAQQRRLIANFVRDTTLGALATGGLLPATMVFVRAFDTPIQADLFAAALTLATPANMVAQALNQVLVPQFARLTVDPREMRRSHMRIFGATAIMFAAVFAVLVALAPWILRVVYGEGFSEGSVAMRALLIVVFLMSATSATSAYMVAAGHQRLYAWLWLGAFAVGTVAMVVTAPAWGMWGATFGFAIGGGGGSLAIMAVGALLRPVPLVRDEG